LTAPAVLADELRRIGREAGLESVGICDARPFSETKAVIEDRKRAGFAAGMAFTYRNPARSTDPSAVLPGAQALVVGARSYLRRPSPAGAGEADVAPPAARVARYSWVDEYESLKAALGVVADRLEEEGWRTRVVADENWMVDRAAAVRAGLGWYGKNANVLLPGRGSWFILGSVVTDAPIAPVIAVTPVEDGCGTCRRCMIDCPTGALVGPGQLDARRCLAWLLQKPGVFPVEHREALGDRIYGCDECQERCPVNRKGDPMAAAPVADADARRALSVVWLLRAGDRELDEAIGRWYIPGREMRYVRRNALLVLGNVGDGADPETEALLRRYLSDRDPLLRAHAVWAARSLDRADLLAGVERDDPMVEAELEERIGGGETEK
jgi:epoxyqueuosine reductase